MKTTFYLQLEPVFSAYGKRPDGEPRLTDIRAQRITRNRPERPMPRSVVVKLTVDIADEAFYPLRPAATLVIPEGLVSTEFSVMAGVVEPRSIEPTDYGVPGEE